MTVSSSGALASNLGDHYHLLYAVRRMINMLHPRSNLLLLTMEGIAKEDILLAKLTKPMLAADVVEYYGGMSFQDASRVVVTQLKYSFAHADRNWTMKRLCNLKTPSDPSSSVIGGLASLFARYASLDDFQPTKLEFQIFTNQPLQPKLARQLNKAEQLISGKDGAEISQILLPITGELKATLDQLKQAVELDWEQLGWFLRCWNRNRFSQPNLSVIEQIAFGEMKQYLDVDTARYIDNLLVYALKCAEAGERNEITVADVFHQLGFSLTDFFPAPYRPNPIDHYQLTKTQDDLYSNIQEFDSGFMVLHGSGGQGKSTELQYFAQSSENPERVIVYDCWAGGKAREPGLERYQLENFLTELINELDALYQTNILANLRDLRPGDVYQSLLERFNKALRLASQIAAKRGHRLVILIDAADEAVKTYQRRTLQRATSSCFLDTLWEFVLPDNCIIVLSTRTENIDRLRIPQDTKLLKVTGFSLEQTKNYINSYLPDFDMNIINEIHTLSEGNPRIIQYAVERLMEEKPKDIFEYISHVVRTPLEESYRQACKDADDGTGTVEKLLAALNELRGPEIGVLAELFGMSVNACQQLLHKLYGVRILGGVELQFANKNFEDFVEKLSMNWRNEIVALISDFCNSAIDESKYAFRNFVYHAFQAKEYRSLIDKQLSGHLTKRINQLAPYPEDVLEDIQYSLLAAMELGEIDAAISFLVTAAEIAHGGDVFAEALETHIDLAVRFDYHHRLIKYLRKSTSDDSRVGPYLSLVRYFAANAKEETLVQALMKEFSQIIREHNTRFKQGHHWNWDQIKNLTLHDCYADSLHEGLERLYRGWSPQETLWTMYADVVAEYDAGEQSSSQVLHEIEHAAIGENQKVFACTGWLLSMESTYTVAEATELAQNLVRIIKEKNIKFSEYRSTFLSSVIMRFIQNGVQLVDLAPLIDLWKPRFPSVYDVTHPPVSDLADFLRWYVLQELLGTTDFKLSEFVPKNEERKSEFTDLRQVLQRLYPASKAYVDALMNASSSSVISLIDQGLEVWKDRYFYLPSKAYHFRSYVYECLNAIVVLPDFHAEIVEKLLTLTEEVLKEHYKGWPEIAEILSRKSQYHSHAENLIYRQADIVISERMPARDKVDMLLKLCRLLLKMQMVIPAQDMFNHSRKYSEQWDYRAFGRSKALIKVSEALQHQGGALSRKQAFDLINVFDYINEVSNDERGLHYPDILRIVSHNHPDAVLQAVRLSDEKKHIKFGQGLIAVGQGIVDQRVDHSKVLWTLMHLSNRDGWADFAKEIANHILAVEPTSNLTNLIDLWTKKIRRGIDVEANLRETADFLEWADANQIKHSQVANMEIYKSYLESIKSFAHSNNSSATTVHAKPVQEQAENDDKTYTFESLVDFMKDGRNESISAEMSESIAKSLSVLTKLQAVEIVEIMVNRPWQYSLNQVIRLLIDLAEYVGVNSYTVSLHKKIQRSIHDYVASQLPSLLYYYQYQPEQFIRFAKSDCIDDETFFSALLTGISTHLNDLSADAMYLVISNIAARFSVQQASSVLDLLLHQAVKAIDRPEIDFVHPLPFPITELIIRFLCEYLGDPRQSICWEVTHTLIDASIESPEIVVPILIEEAKSQVNTRWMSVREWIIFIIHHLALQSPQILQQHTDDIAFHALNPDFPHARIREHACQALLLVEKDRPGTLSAHLLDQIIRINKPIARLVKHRHKDNVNLSDTEIRIEWVDEESPHPSNYPHSERYDVFDFLDTLSYWFEPLGDCFELSRDDVMELAAVWVVDRWGITDEQCREDYRKLRARFGDSQMPLRHQGYLPSIVDLRTYAEYHATQLVAGELIDTEPVYIYEDDHWRTWDSWLRSKVYTADPAITSRLIDTPPLRPEYFGIFSKEYVDWASKSDDNEFLKEIMPERDSEWLVMATYRSGQFDERNFSVTVRCALVHPDTSLALARAIESESPYGISLPTLDLPDDLIGIEEIADYVTTHTMHVDNMSDDLDEHSDERFHVEPIVMSLSASKSLSEYDKIWQGTSLSYLLPVPELVTRMKLTRKSLTLDYFDNENQAAVKWHAWSYTAGYDDREFINGNRLIVRRDLLQSYLELINRHLIFAVRIARQKAYDRRSKTDSYDPGKTKAYILNKNGEIIQC